MQKGDIAVRRRELHAIAPESIYTAITASVLTRIDERMYAQVWSEVLSPWSKRSW